MLKDKLVGFKVTDGEKKDLERYAQKEHLSLSAWIRQVIFKCIDKKRLES